MVGAGKGEGGLSVWKKEKGKRKKEERLQGATPVRSRHCERSEAIQTNARKIPGLLRHFVPRNDGIEGVRDSEREPAIRKRA
jgi:hypothetical protein